MSAQHESGELTGQSYLDRLRAWADGRGFYVNAYPATQREPTHVVSVSSSPTGAALIKRESADSADTAAMYLLNALEVLGALHDG